MKRNLLILLLLGLICTNINAQTKYWVSTYEIRKNSPDLKRYSDANRIFLMQTKDSIRIYDVGKEEFKNRFKEGFSYNRKADSLKIKPYRGINLEATEKNDTLKIYNQGGSIYVYNRLIKSKLKRKRIEKILYTKKFKVVAKELYRPFSDGQENKILRFSKDRTEEKNIYWAKIQEFGGYFFFSMHQGAEKYFPIKSVSNKHILLFAPNKKNNIATLKIVK